MYCQSHIHETDARSLVGTAATAMSDLIEVLRIHTRACPEVISNLHAANQPGISGGCLVRPAGAPHGDCKHLALVDEAEGGKASAPRSSASLPPRIAKRAARPVSVPAGKQKAGKRKRTFRGRVMKIHRQITGQFRADLDGSDGSALAVPMTRLVAGDEPAANVIHRLLSEPPGGDPQLRARGVGS